MSITVTEMMIVFFVVCSACAAVGWYAWPDAEEYYIPPFPVGEMYSCKEDCELNHGEPELREGES